MRPVLLITGLAAAFAGLTLLLLHAQATDNAATQDPDPFAAARPLPPVHPRPGWPSPDGPTPDGPSPGWLHTAGTHGARPAPTRHRAGGPPDLAALPALTGSGSAASVTWWIPPP